MRNTIITQITPTGKTTFTGLDSAQLIAQIEFIENHVSNFNFEVMRKLNHTKCQGLNSIELPIDDLNHKEVRKKNFRIDCT